MTPKTPQFVFSILLTASAVALGWGIYREIQPPEEPAPPAPATDEPAMEPDEMEQTARIEIPPPLTDFSEMVARPLFSQTRSPEEASPDEPDSPLPAEPTGKSRLLVMGIIITDQEKVALLKQNNPQSSDTIKVTEGQEVSGWKVASITPEAVTVSQRDTTDVIKLSDNVLSDAEKRRLEAQAKASNASRERKTSRTANRTAPKTPPAARVPFNRRQPVVKQQ